MAKSNPYRTPKKSKRKGSYNSMRSQAGRIAAQAAMEVAMSKLGSYMSTSSDGPRRNVIDSTTAQADRTAIPLKRRRGRYAKKRRFRKFQRKVVTAVNRTGPTRTHNKTHSYSIGVPASVLNVSPNGFTGRQRVQLLPILAYSRTGNQQFDDLNELQEIVQLNGSADEIQAASPVIFLKSYLFEIMMTNVSAGDETNAMYVDVYYWKTKRVSNYDLEDIVAATNAQLQTQVVAGGTGYVNALDPEAYGWTPYQNTHLMKVISIFKKERYYIQPGGNAQIEWRARINKTWRKDQSDATGATVTNKQVPGITQGLMLISYGCPKQTANQLTTGPHAIVYSANKTLYYERVKMGAPSADTVTRTVQ